ncbi:MAG: CsbD family protein [Solirubrobacterales bacterium]|nr:CsbD family protein [Solirubrobacterales bacterium]
MTDKKADEAIGRAKEAAGALTDDKDLKNEGKADQASASVKDKVENAVDKVKDKLTGR